MVSESEVITVTSVCSCGSGDTTNAKETYFLNKCPVCDYKGTLEVLTNSNVQLSSDEFKLNEVNDNDNREESESNSNEALKVRCSYCGAEFCGYDGYDLYGGTRGGLTVVNPDEVTSDNDEVSEEQEEDKTYMSGWEGLCDLLRPLDGEAMIVQRGDFVIVKKIEAPETARLWAYEGFNVVDDSVTITDYTPEIYNTFLVKWGESYENEMEFVFEKHKALFGERKYVVEAKRVKNIKKGSGEEGEQNKDESSSTDNGWSITDIVSTAISVTPVGMIGGAANDLLNGSSEEGSNGLGSEEDDVQTEETPITTREEAIQFGLTQIGKAKREDGHTIELKVIGNQNWQMGEWCHVRLPSFNEDAYMFISKCNFESSADSEYIHSLTLVDYPPSLGKPLNGKSSSEENTEETEENNEENSDESSTGTNEDTGSSSSSGGGGGALK